MSPPSIRTTNKLDFYWFCVVLLASLKSQYRVLRRFFSLYLWHLGGYVPARYLFADRSHPILSQHCQAVIKNQTLEAGSLRDLTIIKLRSVRPLRASARSFGVWETSDITEKLGKCDRDIRIYQTLPWFLFIAVLKKVRYALCPMPYALCPMPYAQSYLMLLRKAIIPLNSPSSVPERYA